MTFSRFLKNRGQKFIDFQEFLLKYFEDFCSGPRKVGPLSRLLAASGRPSQGKGPNRPLRHGARFQGRPWLKIWCGRGANQPSPTRRGLKFFKNQRFLKKVSKSGLAQKGCFFGADRSVWVLYRPYGICGVARRHLRLISSVGLKILKNFQIFQN